MRACCGRIFWPTRYIAPDERGSLMPAPAYAYCISPDASKPTVLAPVPVPRVGPLMPPPAQENGTPRCDRPRAITTSVAC
ncbi:hypothetical protein PICSAR25_02853 [Mycobacterium avium subsp. paratuberculosis]|nr:hypothetical protein PICSAR25_02853 [Mycobacterium avium subsp. paratuberculosis]